MKKNSELARINKSSRLAKRLIRISIPIALALAAFIIILSSNNQIQAEESEYSVKRYTSIMINPGDSLWSIASDHADGHYSTLQEYIDELMSINNLTSDKINAYEYLIIPYYIN